jgi:hypothetical protein
MKYFSQASGHWFSGLVAPVGLVVTAATLLSIDLSRSSKVYAWAVPDADTDGDGLVDRQERVIGTLPSVADSDEDGFSDAEEIARKSSPVLPQLTPISPNISVGLTAHGERDGLHAVIVVYLPDGNPRDVDIRLGTLVGRRLVVLPEGMFVGGSHLSFAPAADPNALLAIVDFRFDRTWVSVPGHLAMFATVARKGGGHVLAADSINLFEIGGIEVLAQVDPYFMPAFRMTGGPTGGPGTIYRPLPGGSETPPTGWTLDEVCFQTAQPMGASGCIVSNEVVSADCQSGWDGSCPPNCSSSVGTTYTSVDPVVLIGG